MTPYLFMWGQKDRACSLQFEIRRFVGEVSGVCILEFPHFVSIPPGLFLAVLSWGSVDSHSKSSEELGELELYGNRGFYTAGAITSIPFVFRGGIDLVFTL